MLENRSFDHMLGFLYPGNVTPSGQPFEGLAWTESNPGSNGQPVTVFKIEPTTPNAYYMPGADPGDGYMATNDQLYGNDNGPASSGQAATCQGFIADYAYTLGWQSKESASWPIVPGTVEGDIMGCFTPAALPVLSALASHFGQFTDSQAAAAAGTLPAYTFLEPSWSSSGNSQHPNYDVALGEQLIHDVYEALRAGPGWPGMLLVITYDEHGGCYDHVPPPWGAVPPDHDTGEFSFGFDRFGVRVPTVLVSPLIAAGTVYRVPAGGTPLDHTSVLKTIEQRWNLAALTARDAAAPGFGDVFTLSTPRTDDVLAGVTVPVASGPGPSAGTVSHLESIRAELISRQFPAGVSVTQGRLRGPLCPLSVCCL